MNADSEAKLSGLFRARLTPIRGVEDYLDFEISCPAIGRCDPTATDRERIAYLVSRVPSSDLLKLPTDKQLQVFLDARFQGALIALCLLGGHQVGDFLIPSNPIAEMLRNGEICQWMHDYIWMNARLYDAVWALISIKEPLISEALGSLWEGKFAFFERLVKQNVDGQISRFFQAFFHDSPAQRKKWAKLQRKKMQTGFLDAKEEAKLQALFSKYGEVSCWTQLVAAIEPIAQRDIALASLLNQVAVAMDACLAMKQDLYCKPRLARLRGISREWREGEVA